MLIPQEMHREIAEAIVAQGHPGYDNRSQGERFIVDTNGDGEADSVVFRGSNTPDPWPTKAEAVPVEALTQDDPFVLSWDEDEDEEDAVIFVLGYIPDEI